MYEIRNIKFLDENIINNIRNMSYADKMEFIITYNDVIERIEGLLR